MNLYKGSPTFVVTTSSEDFLGRSSVVVLERKEVESVNLIFRQIKDRKLTKNMAAGEEMETESPEIEIVDVEKDARA